MAGVRKLIVEVSNAKNLMPKDGQGTTSTYAVVDFDGQRRRTNTKLRDLNPDWDEKLEFLVHDKGSMAAEILEINLYNDKKAGKRTTFLGKVKIPGSGFVPAGSETLVYFPLEKRSVFSQIKGELGLKVYYIDEDPPAADDKKPEPAAEPAATVEEKPLEEVKTEGGEKKEEKAEEKKEEEKKDAAPENKMEEAEKPKENTPLTEQDKNEKKAEDKQPPPPAAAAEAEGPYNYRGGEV